MRDQKPEKNTDAGDRAETAPTDRGTSAFTSMREGIAGDAASSLTLRLASADDAVAVGRLAALDSSRPPAQPVLLAEVGRELYAALSLSEHTLVADPFRPTAELHELMRARARQLDPTRRATRSRRRSRLRLRFLPATS